MPRSKDGTPVPQILKRLGYKQQDCSYGRDLVLRQVGEGKALADYATANPGRETFRGIRETVSSLKLLVEIMTKEGRTPSREVPIYGLFEKSPATEKPRAVPKILADMGYSGGTSSKGREIILQDIKNGNRLGEFIVLGKTTKKFKSLKDTPEARTILYELMAEEGYEPHTVEEQAANRKRFGDPNRGRKHPKPKRDKAEFSKANETTAEVEEMFKTEKRAKITKDGKGVSIDYFRSQGIGDRELSMHTDKLVHYRETRYDSPKSGWWTRSSADWLIQKLHEKREREAVKNTQKKKRSRKTKTTT
jgi:hypothetical protein